MYNKTSFEKPSQMPEKSGLSREVTSQKRSVYMLNGHEVSNLLACHERVAAHERDPLKTGFTVCIEYSRKEGISRIIICTSRTMSDCDAAGCIFSKKVSLKTIHNAN